MIQYLLAMMTVFGVQALLTLSLNVQYGLAGILNFGLVAFYAIGAYASALLTLAGIPFPVAVGLGVLISVATSALLAATTLRLNPGNFAIVTLGFAEAVRILIVNVRGVTHGTLGIAEVPRPYEHAFAPSSYAAFYLSLVAATGIIVFLFCGVLARSPLGRTLRAIRDDDEVAMSIGKNPLHFRILSFGWGAGIASIAGSFWAHYVTYVVPEQFTAEVTFYTWMAMIIGGVGSMAGSLWGAGIMVVLLEGTRFIGDVVPIDAPRVAALRQMIIGVGLIYLAVYGGKRIAIISWIGAIMRASYWRRAGN